MASTLEDHMHAIIALFLASQAPAPTADPAAGQRAYDRFMAGEVRLDQMSDEEALKVIRTARQKRQGKADRDAPRVERPRQAPETD